MWFNFCRCCLKGLFCVFPMQENNYPAASGFDRKLFFLFTFSVALRASWRREALRLFQNNVWQLIKIVDLLQFSALFPLCCFGGHGFPSLVLPRGVVTAPATAAAAAVAGAAGGGGAGCSGRGFLGTAARCERPAPGGGGWVQPGRWELRAAGRGARRVGGRPGPGEWAWGGQSCSALVLVL